MASRVAAHAHGTQGIIAASRAGVTSIEHASILDDEAIRILKENGTWIVPQLFLPEWIKPETMPPVIAAKAAAMRELVAASIRKAAQAGVRIGFGSDSSVVPFALTGREFAARVRIGMAPLEVLRQATVYNAELLDTPDRGVIAVGKLADLGGRPRRSAGRHQRDRARRLRDEGRRGLPAAGALRSRAAALSRGTSPAPG